MEVRPLPFPSLSLLQLTSSDGTAQGIGAAIGLRFAQAGANVFIIGRNEKLGQDVVNRLREQAGDRRSFEFIKADLS